MSQMSNVCSSKQGMKFVEKDLIFEGPICLFVCPQRIAARNYLYE